MNSQEQLLGGWVMIGTMIYTEEQAKALADAAVAAEAQKVETKDKEPLSEEEKARLWRAVMESCSG